TWYKNITYTNISPDGKKFLVTKGDGMPALELLGRPHVHLGETDLDHIAMRSRRLTTRNSVGFDLFYYQDERTVSVEIPEGARVSNPSFSPDGLQLAFFALFKDETHIYVADCKTGKSRRVTPQPVLATMVSSFKWVRQGKAIQTVLVPDYSDKIPPPPATATSPKVRVNRVGKNPSRTYQYLLEMPYDKELLEFLITGQLAVIDLENDRVEKIGKPVMIRSIDAAPNGEYFRVTQTLRPFSYFVAASSFGSREDMWNLQGESVHEFSSRQLRDGTQTTSDDSQEQQVQQQRGQRQRGQRQRGQQPQGEQDEPQRRSLTWRPDGKGMGFLQTAPRPERRQGRQIREIREDEKEQQRPRGGQRGGPAAQMEEGQIDRVMQWLEPYGEDDVKVIYESEKPISSVQYSDSCQILFLAVSEPNNARTNICVDLGDPETQYPLPREDSLMTKTNEFGMSVVKIADDGETIFYSGNTPHIDKYNFITGKKERLFRGKAKREEFTERFRAVSDDMNFVFTTRENTQQPPDSYMYDLEADEVEKLTNNENFTPDLTNLETERFQVERCDGYKLWVRVTRPAHKGLKLPAIFWFYPREYDSQAAYDRGAGGGGQRGGGASPAGTFRAPSNRSMNIFTLLDYVIVEPDIPIFGPSGQMNNNYVTDLRNGLWAVIDALDKKEYIDRDRLAIGGHSYGAFSTANALAHTPFFKAGIAGDGCYNRTLTPMGFQSERRYYWDAREVYLSMSPLLWANQFNGAMLMYHGMEDSNSGTFPINSERMFQALDGLNKPVSLYMYPYEAHGPAAKETILDMWARWVVWLDIFVMNPEKGKALYKTPQELEEAANQAAGNNTGRTIR
ncbi:prolyl oligopeptidase family serine peptidase, partial [Planctomycetota bacterium]